MTTPITSLTAAELRKHGASAAACGFDIYDETIRAGLTGAELLIFEDAYFVSRLALAAKVARQSVKDLHPV